MVVSPSRNYAYAAIPRTASRSISQWLVHECGGQAVGSHHSVDRPAKYAELPLFVVVRHPVARLASLVRLHSKDPAAWNDYFGRWLDNIARPAHDDVYRSQSWYYDQSGASKAVYFEALVGELRDLWFVRPGEIDRLPRVGVEEYPHHEVSRENIERIEKLHSEDFERFGYARSSA